MKFSAKTTGSQDKTVKFWSTSIISASLSTACKIYKNTVESRFLEPSVSRTSRYLEPNLDSLGFASLKLYNFTPDFSNPRFLETPDNSNQFWLPWDKLTLDNSSLRKFPNQQIKVQFFGPATFYCELRQISKIIRKN